MILQHKIQYFNVKQQTTPGHFRLVFFTMKLTSVLNNYMEMGKRTCRQVVPNICDDNSKT